jgi:hypothetical protein
MTVYLSYKGSLKELSLPEILTEIQDADFYKLNLPRRSPFELSGNKIKNQARRLLELENIAVITPVLSN